MYKILGISLFLLIITFIIKREKPSVHTIVIEETVIQKENDSIFNRLMDVVTHQRCMNCHPNDNIPRQGEDARQHILNISRGSNDKGFEATKCATCHQKENNSYSGVPGAPHWALAPLSMGWQNLSRRQIMERMLDPNLNGGKDHEALVKHMTEDPLVLWAWNPGVNINGEMREVPPLSEEEFKSVVLAWFENGAVIPPNQ